MSRTFYWKPGVVVRIDPQVAGEELDRIRTHHNGNLDPEHIVEASRAPDAPLHNAFEWDDAVAAGKYRVDQAADLIRWITFTEEGSPGAAPIRAFVSIERNKERTYVSTVDAMADPDLRRQVIASAWRELEAWRNRHAELIEFARVFTAIDQARDAE